MPYYPYLNVKANTVLNTQAFYGLNRGLSISDGELADMLNMTGDEYPVLSSRRARGAHKFSVEGGGVTEHADGIAGMLGTDKLIVCSGEHVYVDGVEHGLKVSAEESMKPKHLVSMGAYVCIWPDKVYLNLTNPDDYGSMGTKWTAGDGTAISATMCRLDGTDYDMESIAVSDTAPEAPTDQQLWLDTSGDNDVLKQYSSMHLQWIQVATTYVKIQAEGIGNGLKDGDVVFLSGAKTTSAVAAIAEADTETLPFPVEGFFLYSSFDTTQKSDGSFVSTTPSIDERTKTVLVSGIPAGAEVTSAVLKFTSGTPAYGAKILTVNGISFAYGESVEIPVEVTGNGEYSFLFRYQTYNSASSSGEHAGSVVLSEMSLEVTYAITGEDTGNTDSTDVSFLNTSAHIFGCGNDYIIVAGLLNSAVLLASSLVCELKVPDLDYVCEANNRIWGCSYASSDGTLTNEIRCCALGDFRNWYKFEGTSMDSYVMSVGSDGKFTGAYSLQGVPLIWKADYLHKISGTQPSNFTLNTIKCRGVQDGSWRSLAAVNEVLYYKSRMDVMAYDGAMPYAVGEKLGRERYYEAVAGAYRDKYYINMRDTHMVWHVYVYDTVKGLWHKEDENCIQDMATTRGELVMARVSPEGTVLENVSNPEGTPEAFDWGVTFGVFGFSYENQKYLSRFNIRAQMSAGATMKMEIMYDSDGEWVDMGTMRCPVLRTFLLPIIPRRCDHCQVRLKGTGSIKLYSIARVFEQGGDG